MSDYPCAAADFAFLVKIADVPDAGAAYRLEANKAARAAIAQRFGLDGVDHLGGEARITPAIDGFVVEGRLIASLYRQCVVSLDIFIEDIDEPFRIRLVRDLPLQLGEEDLLETESVEPLEGDSIDLAELLIQQAALAMAPYPRKPGAEPLSDEIDDAGAASPFAVLKGKIAHPGEQE